MEDLDNMIMALSTDLRVSGFVDDAERVESAAAYLREEVKRPQSDLYEALATIRGACDDVMTVIEVRVPHKKEKPE